VYKADFIQAERWNWSSSWVFYESGCRKHGFYGYGWSAGCQISFGKQRQTRIQMTVLFPENQWRQFFRVTEAQWTQIRVDFLQKLTSRNVWSWWWWPWWGRVNFHFFQHFQFLTDMSLSCATCACIAVVSRWSRYSRRWISRWRHYLTVFNAVELVRDNVSKILHRC